MPTIYRQNSERISVADAKQLILKALPIELRAGQIFGKPGPDGEPIWDFDSLAQVSAAEAHAPYLDRDFLELCKVLGFEPHMMFSPAIGGYSSNPEQDNSYMLTHAQFVKLAENYSLTVEIETASPAQAQSTAEPAPVIIESPEQRRARWLEWYGKGERGAVRAVYERELKINPKADRSFIGKQIKLARQEKADAQRAGTWTAQLVQDGKRKP